MRLSRVIGKRTLMPLPTRGSHRDPTKLKEYILFKGVLIFVFGGIIGSIFGVLAGALLGFFGGAIWSAAMKEEGKQEYEKRYSGPGGISYQGMRRPQREQTSDEPGWQAGDLDEPEDAPTPTP
jgi:hypothetical protein